MPDVKVVRHQLVANAALAAVVDEAGIVGGVIPQGTPLPAIAVNHISAMPRHPVKPRATTYRVARVQVTVQAASYPELRQTLALARGALAPVRGVIAGVSVDSLLLDSEGPDFRNDEAGIFMGSIDCIVAYSS